MSSKSQEPLVSMTQAEYNLLVSKAQGTKLGSLVLLRNKKLEEFWDSKIASGEASEDDRVVKYTAHSSFYVGLEFWNEVKRSIDSDPLNRCQVDVSMNQSNFKSHDRLDPEGVDNAPTFWLDLSSEMQLETLAQHEIRDPDSAYDMSKGAENTVSKGVISKRKVA